MLFIMKSTTVGPTNFMDYCTVYEKKLYTKKQKRTGRQAVFNNAKLAENSENR